MMEVHSGMTASSPVWLMQKDWLGELTVVLLQPSEHNYCIKSASHKFMHDKYVSILTDVSEFIMYNCTCNG